MTDDIQQLLEKLDSDDFKRVEQRAQASYEPQDAVDESDDVAHALRRVEESVNEVRRSRGERTVGLLSPAMTATVGVDLRGEGRHAEARPLLEAAAEAGDAMAQGTFGLVREEEGNVEDATKWLELAANAGDDMAQYNLGRILAKVERVEEAKEWLHKSRDPRAAEELARLGE